MKTRKKGPNVTLPRHWQVLEAALGSAARTRIMQRFRQQAGPRVLLASDVATRGLDVPDITHVVGTRARHRRLGLHRCAFRSASERLGPSR